MIWLWARHEKPSKFADALVALRELATIRIEDTIERPLNGRVSCPGSRVPGGRSMVQAKP